MKRKMVYIGISYVLGLFFASFFQGILQIFLLFILSLCFLIPAVGFNKCSKKEAIAIFICFFFGIIQMTSYTSLYYKPIVSYSGREINFTGKVISSDSYNGDKASYTLKGKMPNGLKAKIHVYTDDYGCRYGDIITLKGIPEIPESDYLFSAYEYYKSDGIFLEIKTPYSNEDGIGVTSVIHIDSYKLIHKLEDYREKTIRRIYALSGRESGSIMVSMLFGDKDNLEQSISNAFFHSGIGHIMSVSGFHLMLLIFLFGWVGNRYRLQKIIQFCISVVLVVLFTIITYSPISVLRAGIMALIAQSSCIFFRKPDTLNSLCIAMIFLTLFQPYSVRDSSFLLSVSGTYGIAVFAPYMTKSFNPSTIIGKLCKSFLMMFCVTLCTMPVSVLFFSETSILSPVSNIILIPFCSIILFCAMMILMFGEIFFIAEFFAWIGDSICSLLVKCINLIERVFPFDIPLGWDVLPKLIAVFLFIVVIIYFITQSRKALAVVISIYLIFLSTAIIFHKDVMMKSKFQIHILGRNEDGIILVTNDKISYAFDITGDRKNPKYLQKYLKENGIDDINLLCIMQNSGQMVASYKEKLSGYTIKDIIIDTYWDLGTSNKILNQVPVFSENFSVKIRNGSIAVDSNNIIITYKTNRILISSDKEIIKTSDFDIACFSNKNEKTWNILKNTKNDGEYNLIYKGNVLEIYESVNCNMNVRSVF